MAFDLNVEPLDQGETLADMNDEPPGEVPFQIHEA